MATYPASGVLATTSVVGGFARDAKLFTIVQDFDLDVLVSAKLTTADVVNLLTLPAKTVILAGTLEILRLCVGASALTLQLRAASTAVTAALESGTGGTAGSIVAGGASGVLNAYGNTAAQSVNVLAGTITGTTTANPKIRVTLVCLDVTQVN